MQYTSRCACPRNTTAHLPRAVRATENVMRPSRFVVVMLASLALALVLTNSGSAQTFTTLSWFPGFDQFGVFSPLIQGTDGNYYGTALDDSGGYGNVYKITPSGLITILYNFCSLPNCADGSEPEGGPLVLGTDGNFYGVTYLGGASCALLWQRRLRNGLPDDTQRYADRSPHVQRPRRHRSNRADPGLGRKLFRYDGRRRR